MPDYHFYWYSGFPNWESNARALCHSLSGCYGILNVSFNAIASVDLGTCGHSHSSYRAVKSENIERPEKHCFDHPEI